MKISRALRFTGGFIGGGFAGAGISHVVTTNVENIGKVGVVPLWQMLIYAVLIFYAAIAVHEAGHWLAGLSVRFRTLRVSVGPLMINRREGKTSLLWNRGLLLMGGITAMIPDNDRNLSRRFGWFVAGGPLASLIAGLACLAATPFMATSWLKIAVIVFGCISLLITLITLIPTQAGGFHSDGARLLMLQRGGDAVKRLIAMLQLTSESQAGTRPRDWSHDAIAILESGAHGADDDVVVSSMLYAYAGDTENVDLARTILERQLSSTSETCAAFRANWCLEAAFFAARYDNDPIRAREWQKKGKGARLVDAVIHHMIETEILLAEGRLPEARRILEKAALALPKAKFLQKGYPVAEKIEKLGERIRDAESMAAAA